MRYYVSWKTTGYYRKDSLKLAARCPVSGCWPSCLHSGTGYIEIAVFVLLLIFADFSENFSERALLAESNGSLPPGG